MWRVFVLEVAIPSMQHKELGLCSFVYCWQLVHLNLCLLFVWWRFWWMLVVNLTGGCS